MLLACSPAFGGLIVNGDFETGTTSSWALTAGLTGGSGVVIAADLGPAYAYCCSVTDLVWPAYAGSNFSAYLGPVDPGYLSQSVSTDTGHTYNVTFALSMFPLTPDAADPNIGGLSLTPNAFQAKWGDTVLTGWADGGSFLWTPYTFSGLAPSAGTSTTLSFEFYAPNWSFALDNVDVNATDASISSIPEPASLLLLGTGLMSAGWYLRRKIASGG